MSKELHPESCILISKTDQFRAIFQSLIRVALGQALVLLINLFQILMLVLWGKSQTVSLQ